MCEDNDLAIDIVTAKPFHGNIFVKGRAKDKSCRQSYANNGSNSYSLPLGKCGMQRLRSANPRGVNFVVTVLVSFHPAGFITKNDRAFHVKCFYMEPDSIVSQSIDVSSLPTTELQDSMTMPKCEYSVRRDSPNGPTLTFANVGETVYHVWECNPPDMGMLVKKCFVTDGDALQTSHNKLSDLKSRTGGRPSHRELRFLGSIARIGQFVHVRVPQQQWSSALQLHIKKDTSEMQFG
ncbi:unnamed protein product [Heligmosomoides polygyrus]|uniref:ZP domain-containing protein n=1 Tax=Heligmosomoides polygyrus TaxID=6339 RepID=A0A3P8BNA5_HELPZ|nr:unnamed protein product [Heligmosomoides polygyrus]